jgi:TonB family protein
VIAYQLLVGDIARPVPPNWMTVLGRLAVPHALIALIGKCMEVPDQRFADAGAVLAALETAKQGGPTGDPARGAGGAAATATPKPSADGWRRHLPLAVAASILLIALVVLARLESQTTSPASATPSTNAGVAVPPTATATDTSQTPAADNAPAANAQASVPAVDIDLEDPGRPNRPVVKPPDVTLGQADVRGSLDKEIIRRIIRRHINEIRYCYEQELTKKPNLGGRILVQFTIAASGQVVASVLQNSTMGNARVENCAVQAVKRWEFPKPLGGGIVIVSYPFVLTPARADD